MVERLKIGNHFPYSSDIERFILVIEAIFGDHWGK